MKLRTNVKAGAGAQKEDTLAQGVLKGGGVIIP
jgi:hypothetical protein